MPDSTSALNIERSELRSATLPLGPAQRSLRVTHADDTLTLEIGWPDPWRPERRLTLPVDIAPALIEALASLNP